MTDTTLLLNPKSLVTVAYGCHRSAHKKIKQHLLDNNKIIKYPSFIFSEYFFDRIVSEKTDLKKVKLSMPFLSRVIGEYKYWLEPMVVDDENNSKKVVGFEISAKDSDKIKGIIGLNYESIKMWDSNTERLLIWKKSFKWENENPDIAWDNLHTNKIIEIVSDPQKRIQKAYIDEVHPEKKDAGASVKDISFKFQLLPFFHFKSSICILRIPIKSCKCVYGYLLIIILLPESEKTSITKEHKKTIIEFVKFIETEVIPQYLDTIILLHENNFELKVQDVIKDAKIKLVKDDGYASAKGIVGEIIKTVGGWKENTKNVFEEGFWKIWDYRKYNIGINATTNKEKKKKMEDIEKTLHFAEYNVASKVMIDTLREVVLSAKNMPSPGKKKSLSSALVYGEAGSGKDTLAKIIHLFSEYRTQKLETINMAALKPAYFTLPLLFGVNLPFLKPLRGMLSFENDNDGKVISNSFILDELNSMDYDVQGSLLRLLENGEIRTMFSETGANIKSLIIGIVNEKPDEVMREEECNMLKNSEPFLGKAAGALMYDMICKTRRLRPDLVYRLKRGIYVELPPLRERREDIPVLFNAFLKKDVQKIVSYDTLAFDALMNPAIVWPGNIRQLQALAGNISNMVEKKNETTFILKAQDIVNGMKKIDIELDLDAFEF